MFYVSSINGSSVGVTDTYDNVEEFYSPNQIKEISNYLGIKGVSFKGVKKIDLGEALLTREIVEEINCERELSFEVVDNLAKYKLLFGGEVINNDFMVVETDTSIKLISDKVIMLDNSIVDDDYVGLFEQTWFTKIDFHNTNTSNVENMIGMFYECRATSLDLSSFDTSNVKSMSSMFMNFKVTSLDLSNFNTSNVVSMYSIFNNCHAKSINLSSFNTSNVEDMNSMFQDCHATSLDLSKFNTSNVKDMGSMFYECHAKSIDLSNFDTSNLTSICNMFHGCRAESIDLSNFDTSNIEFMTCVFQNYTGTIKSTDSKILQAYNSRG